MSCQPECSSSVPTLRKRKSELLPDNDEDAGIPKLKRMRSSLRLAAQQAASLFIDTPSMSRENSGRKGQKRKHDEQYEEDDISPPVKKIRVASQLEGGEQSKESQVEVNQAEKAIVEETPMDTGDVQDNDARVEKDPQDMDEKMDVNPEQSCGVPADEELGAVGGAAETTIANTTDPAVFDEQFESDWELICEVHPDCDPVYIREQLTVLINDPQRVSTVTFDIYANDEYPKRAAREEREQLLKQKEELMNMTLDLEAFHKRYPDPMAVFNVLEGDVYELYYDHAEVFLKNTFPWIQVAFIKKTLRLSGFHLTPAFIKLKALNDAISTDRKRRSRKGRGGKQFRLYPRSEEYEYPENPDDDFFWERLYLLNMDQINDCISEQKEAHRQRYEAAKAEGKLHDCSICLEADVLEEDMICCNDGHFFCLECVRKYAEERVGQGRSTFPCLDGTCNNEFSFCTLERAMTPHMFSLAVRTVQIAQLKEAAIENLETCPFCPYAVIVPYDNTATLFHCENDDCMQDSCRKCKDVAHVPFSCSEFKSMREITMRSFIENQMAEAMIRNCPKCGLRFFKEEGCNHMRCSTCRTSICYVCREVIKGYDHFIKNPKCGQYTDTTVLHRQEVTQAFEVSPDRFKEEHPEYASLDIKLNDYNPLQILAI